MKNTKNFGPKIYSLSVWVPASFIRCSSAMIFCPKKFYFFAKPCKDEPKRKKYLRWEHLKANVPEDWFPIKVVILGRNFENHPMGRWDISFMKGEGHDFLQLLLRQPHLWRHQRVPLLHFWPKGTHLLTQREKDDLRSAKWCHLRSAHFCVHYVV